MAHWLFKSEPSVWSFERLVGCGADGTDWSGVRNHSAKLNMQAMKVGDLGFFYHSNEGKGIVGIVVVCKAYRPDPTDATGKFGMVDIRAVRAAPASRLAGSREGRETSRLNGARHQLPPFRAACDGPGMGANLRDGRTLTGEARDAASHDREPAGPK